MNFSLLTPTRNRPDNIARLIKSIEETVDDLSKIEIVLRYDDDDIRTIEFVKTLKLTISIKLVCLSRPKFTSEAFNEAWLSSSGSILMLCADDIVFRTKGWDTIVQSKFDNYQDRIVYIYGCDGLQNERLGTHGFVHRKWTDALGYFTPPGYMMFNDLWLHRLGEKIGRITYLPNVFTEHMHWSIGKAEKDDTYDRICNDSIYDNEKFFSDEGKAIFQVDANRLKNSIYLHYKNTNDFYAESIKCGAPVSMIGLWEFGDQSFPYGDNITYRKAAEFLSDCDTIEDWGCGTAYFKRFVPRAKYVGVDGSRSKFCDVVVDLQNYVSNVDGILMRHVLDLNCNWEEILINALKSFKKKLVLIFNIPFGDTTKQIATYHNIPGISFRESDIVKLIKPLHYVEESVKTTSQYGREIIFYIDR